MPDDESVYRDTKGYQTTEDVIKDHSAKLSFSVLSIMNTYNIPKRKVKRMVDQLSQDSREYEELQRIFQGNIYSIGSVSKTYHIREVYEVYNPNLETKYNRLKRAWKEKGYADDMVMDSYGFMNLGFMDVKEICELITNGLKSGHMTQSFHCDPSLGVQLCRHPDVTSEYPLRDAARTIIVFKFMKGKVKTVVEQPEHETDMKREPQYGFDTIISNSAYGKGQNLYLSRMYYIYHFENAADIKPVDYPPQLCPVAIITFAQVPDMPVKTPLGASAPFNYKGLLTYMKDGILPPSYKPRAPPPPPVSESQKTLKPVPVAEHIPSTVVTEQVKSNPPEPPTDHADILSSDSDDVYIPTGAENLRPKLIKPNQDSNNAINTFLSCISNESVANCMNIAELYYIHSPTLNLKFEDLKKSWTEKNFEPEYLEDAYGFLDVTGFSIQQLGDICANGLKVGIYPRSLLAKPCKGIQLFHHPDITSEKIEMAYEKVILMCRYLKGRQLKKAECFRSNQLEDPQFGYDCITSERSTSGTTFLSKTAYLYHYCASTDSEDPILAQFPPQALPVAFLRVMFRKSMRFKIPKVKVPNLAKLAECMQGMDAKTQSETSLQPSTCSSVTLGSARKSVPSTSIARTHSLDQGTYYSVKAPSGTLLAAFTPSSLRNKYKKTYTRSPLAKTLSATSDPPDKEATKSSLDVASEKPKDTNKFDKFKNLLSLKDKLKKNKELSPHGFMPSSDETESVDSFRSTGKVSSTAQCDTTEKAEEKMEVDALKIAPVSDEMAEKDSKPIKQADESEQTEAQQKDNSNTSSDSDSDIPVPKLRLRSRAAPSSSESDTEGSSPIVHIRRRGRPVKLVLDSEESDAELKCAKIQKFSKRRQINIGSHLGLYLSDKICPVVTDDNVPILQHDKQLIIKSQDEVTEKPSNEDNSNEEDKESAEIKVKEETDLFTIERLCRELLGGPHLKPPAQISGALMDKLDLRPQVLLERIDFSAKCFNWINPSDVYNPPAPVPAVKKKRKAKKTAASTNKKAKTDSAPEIHSTQQFEEVDIFASMRSQTEVRPVRRKRRASASPPASLSQPPAEENVEQGPEDEPSNKLARRVYFNLNKNTIHRYEADVEMSIIKTFDNVHGEASPMKKISLREYQNINSPVSTPIETTNIEPVLDVEKGYMRLPELPLFVEQPAKSPIPGSVCKKPDQVGDVPSANTSPAVVTTTIASPTTTVHTSTSTTAIPDTLPSMNTEVCDMQIDSASSSPVLTEAHPSDQEAKSSKPKPDESTGNLTVNVTRPDIKDTNSAISPSSRLACSSEVSKEIEKLLVSLKQLTEVNTVSSTSSSSHSVNKEKKMSPSTKSTLGLEEINAQPVSHTSKMSILMSAVRTEPISSTGIASELEVNSFSKRGGSLVDDSIKPTKSETQPLKQSSFDIPSVKASTIKAHDSHLTKVSTAKYIGKQLDLSPIMPLLSNEKKSDPTDKVEISNLLEKLSKEWPQPSAHSPLMASQGSKTEDNKNLSLKLPSVKSVEKPPEESSGQDSGQKLHTSKELQTSSHSKAPAASADGNNPAIASSFPPVHETNCQTIYTETHASGSVDMSSHPVTCMEYTQISVIGQTPAHTSSSVADLAIVSHTESVPTFTLVQNSKIDSQVAVNHSNLSVQYATVGSLPSHTTLVSAAAFEHKPVSLKVVAGLQQGTQISTSTVDPATISGSSTESTYITTTYGTGDSLQTAAKEELVSPDPESSQKSAILQDVYAKANQDSVNVPPSTSQKSELSSIVKQVNAVSLKLLPTSLLMMPSSAQSQPSSKQDEIINLISSEEDLDDEVESMISNFVEDGLKTIRRSRGLPAKPSVKEKKPSKLADIPRPPIPHLPVAMCSQEKQYSLSESDKESTLTSAAAAVLSPPLPSILPDAAKQIATQGRSSKQTSTVDKQMEWDKQRKTSTDIAKMQNVATSTMNQKVEQNEPKNNASDDVSVPVTLHDQFIRAETSEKNPGLVHSNPPAAVVSTHTLHSAARSTHHPPSEMDTRLKKDSATRYREFLCDLKKRQPDVDAPSYLDSILDSADEIERTVGLDVPVFSYSKVELDHSVKDIVITVRKVTSDTSTKERPTRLFWETCPQEDQIKTCQCVTSTLANEQLPMESSGFADQDQTDIIRLAVAYSSDNQSGASEHIVTINHNPLLFQHIPYELYDKINHNLSLIDKGVLATDLATYLTGLIEDTSEVMEDADDEIAASGLEGTPKELFVSTHYLSLEDSNMVNSSCLPKTEDHKKGLDKTIPKMNEDTVYPATNVNVEAPSTLIAASTADLDTVSSRRSHMTAVPITGNEKSECREERKAHAANSQFISKTSPEATPFAEPDKQTSGIQKVNLATSSLKASSPVVKPEPYTEQGSSVAPLDIFGILSKIKSASKDDYLKPDCGTKRLKDITIGSSNLPKKQKEKIHSFRPFEDSQTTSIVPESTDGKVEFFSGGENPWSKQHDIAIQSIAPTFSGKANSREQPGSDQQLDISNMSISIPSSITTSPLGYTVIIPSLKNASETNNEHQLKESDTVTVGDNKLPPSQVKKEAINNKHNKMLLNVQAKVTQMDTSVVPGSSDFSIDEVVEGMGVQPVSNVALKQIDQGNTAYQNPDMHSSDTKAQVFTFEDISPKTESRPMVDYSENIFGSNDDTCLPSIHKKRKTGQLSESLVQSPDSIQVAGKVFDYDHGRSTSTTDDKLAATVEEGIAELRKESEVQEEMNPLHSSGQQPQEDFPKFEMLSKIDPESARKLYEVAALYNSKKLTFQEAAKMTLCAGITSTHTQSPPDTNSKTKVYERLGKKHGLPEKLSQRLGEKVDYPLSESSEFNASIIVYPQSDTPTHAFDVQCQPESSLTIETHSLKEHSHRYIRYRQNVTKQHKSEVPSDYHGSSTHRFDSVPPLDRADKNQHYRKRASSSYSERTKDASHSSGDY